MTRTFRPRDAQAGYTLATLAHLNAAFRFAAVFRSGTADPEEVARVDAALDHTYRECMRASRRWFDQAAPVPASGSERAT